jgi:hypothetical protein
MNINYEDITVVTRAHLLRDALLKELADITIFDIKDKKIIKKSVILIFKDFDNKLKVLK